MAVEWRVGWSGWQLLYVVVVVEVSSWWKDNMDFRVMIVFFLLSLPDNTKHTTHARCTPGGQRYWWFIISLPPISMSNSPLRCTVDLHTVLYGTYRCFLLSKSSIVHISVRSRTELLRFSLEVMVTAVQITRESTCNSNFFISKTTVHQNNNNRVSLILFLHNKVTVYLFFHKIIIILDALRRN